MGKKTMLKHKLIVLCLCCTGITQVTSAATANSKGASNPDPNCKFPKDVQPFYDCSKAKEDTPMCLIVNDYKLRLCNVSDIIPNEKPTQVDFCPLSLLPVQIVSVQNTLENLKNATVCQSNCYKNHQPVPLCQEANFLNNMLIAVENSKKIKAAPADLGNVNKNDISKASETKEQTKDPPVQLDLPDETQSEVKKQPSPALPSSQENPKVSSPAKPNIKVAEEPVKKKDPPAPIVPVIPKTLQVTEGKSTIGKNIPNSQEVSNAGKQTDSVPNEGGEERPVEEPPVQSSQGLPDAVKTPDVGLNQNDEDLGAGENEPANGDAHLDDEQEGNDGQMEGEEGEEEDENLLNINQTPIKNLDNEGLKKEKEEDEVKISDNTSAQSVSNGDYITAPDSHFFYYFIFFTCVSVIGYIAFHNKNKILALALEGRRGSRQGRRRPNSANYRKLDSNLEEAMISHPARSRSPPQVIY